MKGAMTMTEQQIPGKFVWFELVTPDASRARAFYGEVLGWKVHSYPMGAGTYDMLLAGDTLDSMVGGLTAPRGDGGRARWISTVSVEDVDAAVAAVRANGGRVVEGPQELPGVGRAARIVDPQGAELGLLRRARGDKPDALAPVGHFLWSELHTSDAAAALAFHEAVLGFAHRTVPMGHGGAYHILSRGGVDRAGVTAYLPAGVSPHWLPYVAVDDVDATVARARALGAQLPMAPEDIPGIGRFGIFADLDGAVLAVMKPLPRAR
jgi:predicted enzyme related to lactoylglutathione lyase